MGTNFIENAKDVKVSEYTKMLIFYYAQVENMHKSIIEIENKFSEENNGLELTGILLHEPGFSSFKNLLKELIANSVKVQVERTNVAEI